MPLTDEQFQEEKGSLIFTLEMLNGRETLSDLLFFLEINEQSIRNKKQHDNEQARQFMFPFIPYFHKNILFFLRIVDKIKEGSFEEQVELVPLLLNILEVLDNKTKEFTKDSNLLKNELVEMLVNINETLQQIPNNTALKEVIENITKKKQAMEKEAAKISKDPEDIEIEDIDIEFEDLEQEKNTANYSSLDDEKDSSPEEATDKSQAKMAGNKSDFYKLIRIIDTLQDNIVTQKKGRNTTRNSQWKAILLNDIKNTLLSEENPLIIDTEHYMAAVRKVCAMKRNNLHFWAKPHSASEVEKLFADADIISAKRQYKSSSSN